MEKNLKRRALLILNKLKKTFPDARIELDYKKDDPWQLLVVVCLSAQTTDKKVNEISKALFKRFKTVKDFADASSKELEPYIKSIGLYRNKAQNLIKAAQKLIADFAGQVPKDREKLETLAGVGKKSSAVIVANAFNTPAMPVDTHVARVSHRLGLSKEKSPHKIELELTALYSKEKLIDAHHVFIFHGRRICIAKKPYCSRCPVVKLCPQVGVLVSQ